MKLVEFTPRISVADVVAPVGGRPEPARAIFLSGETIEITCGTCFGPALLVCPGCGVGRRHLYLPEIRCRCCLGLAYSSQYGAGQAMPLAGRIVRLRRKAGVDPAPFTRIPRRRRGRERFHFLVRMIRHLEAELIAQMSGYIDRAERRLARSDATQAATRTGAGDD